jgi:hypothetical protein
MQKEQLVVKMQPSGDIVDIGADAAKVLPSSRRYRYVQPITITLEDGSSHLTKERALTKPKLAKALESSQRNIDLNRWFVVMSDCGNSISHHLVKFSVGIG